MEYYVADSYKYFTRVGEPFEREGKMYTNLSCKCDRCGGTGIYATRVENGYPVPHPAYNGVCLKCEGTGTVHKIARLYTEKQYAAMQKRKEVEAAKKAQNTEERRVQARAKAFKRWLELNGFNEDGETYLIYGNTYPIKDELKARGYKFSKELKWHGPAAVDVPEDCFVEKICWSNIYNWNEDSCEMQFSENWNDVINEIFSKNSNGEYFGEIGERIRDVPVVLESLGSFDGAYGTSYVYRFNANGAQLIWFTSSWKNLDEGAQYTLTGTVKKHEIYGNVKTTYLSRCLIKGA